MFSFNNKISIRQLQVLLILDIFGIGVTVLPRRVAEFAGQDGWILIIFATIIACIYFYIISSLAASFPNSTFVEYSSLILGKPLGILISCGFIIKIIVSLSLELRVFGEIIKQIMLFNTPFGIIALCMLAVGGFAASKGYETRGRIAEILIFVIFIPIIFVFSIAVTDVDFSNLKPFLTAPPKNIIKGSFFTAFAFSGIDFVMLAYPYLTRPKSAKKGGIQAIIAIGIIMLVITVITIARFGPFDVVHQMWPVLEIMDTIDLPGSFIERQDALIMSFWIISIFVIINAGMFFSSLLLKDIVKKGKHSLYILICIPIIYYISFIPENIGQAYKLMDMVYITFGTAYLIIIPVILLIVSKIRKLGERNYEKK